MSSLSRECFKDRQSYADWYEGKPNRVQLLMDEISDSTEYILGEEDNNAFVSILSDHGIETAEQFVDAFCVEYEGNVESDEFFVIAFNSNTYFFKRLCSYSQ